MDGIYVTQAEILAKVSPEARFEFLNHGPWLKEMVQERKILKTVERLNNHAPKPPVYVTKRQISAKLGEIEEPEKVFSKLLLPFGGVRFDACTFCMLSGPLVYVFTKNGAALYVGYSANGVGRAASPTHQHKRAREEADEVFIWPTADTATAMELEATLIFTLRPLYNKQRPADLRKAHLLGISGRRLQLLASQSVSKKPAA